MLEKFKNLSAFLSLFSILIIIFLLVAYLNLYKKVTDISNQISGLAPIQTSVPISESSTAQVSGLTTDQVQALINKSISNIPKASSIPAPSVKTVATATPAPQKRTVYIPLGTVFSTSAMDWTDDGGAEAYIDINNDYGANAIVTFEASLKPDDGTSQSVARLYDATHSIAVNSSEIQTSGNANYTYTSSQRLYLWQGKNLYRVQLKSPNGVNITIDNAKIKIVY